MAGGIGIGAAAFGVGPGTRKKQEGTRDRGGGRRDKLEAAAKSAGQKGTETTTITTRSLNKKYKVKNEKKYDYIKNYRSICYFSLYFPTDSSLLTATETHCKCLCVCVFVRNMNTIKTYLQQKQGQLTSPSSKVTIAVASVVSRSRRSNTDHERQLYTQKKTQNLSWKANHKLNSQSFCISSGREFLESALKHIDE